MLVGLYASASGMNAQQSKIDSISGNIANVNTVGFKATQVGFADLIYQSLGPSAAATLPAQFGTGVRALDAGRSFTQGSFSETGNPTDLAIQGPGFFQVRLPDGRTALTRAGDFQVDANRRVTTTAGYPLAPPLTLPAGVNVKDLSVSADGTVTAKGQAVGRIAVVDVVAPQQMASIGQNLFLPTPGSGRPTAAPAGSFQIAQGVLELSNVDVSLELTDLIQAQRAYDLASRSVRTIDEMLATANNIKR